MLVLGLKRKEEVDVTGPVRVKFMYADTFNNIKLGFQASKSVHIMRREVSKPEFQAQMEVLLTNQAFSPTAAVAAHIESLQGRIRQLEGERDRLIAIYEGGRV